jgi:TetR/AcrR family transcriptional regulator, regulator of biofilm formation and stress response
MSKIISRHRRTTEAGGQLDDERANARDWQQPADGRGPRRRLAILDATLRVLARAGYGGVTHRAVAAEAAVPLAATTYYFKSKQDLLTEAFRLHAGRHAKWVEGGIEQLRTTSPDAVAAADALAELVVLGVDAGRDALVAEFELGLAATRRPELSELPTQWQGAVVSRLALLLADLGAPDPDGDARVLSSALTGLAVELLFGRLPAADVAPAVRRILGSLVAAPQAGA